MICYTNIINYPLEELPVDVIQTNVVALLTRYTISQRSVIQNQSNYSYLNCLVNTTFITA